MQTVRDIRQLKSALSALRAGGHRLALVPTMGALHAGHLKLVEEAKGQADRVAVSIFVNPMQFGKGEDLDRYPRQVEEDSRLLADAGCDLLWLPTVEDVYPAGFATRVHVEGVSERWEGEARPGHFDGVATVVAKLLLAVHPDVALFGEKDFQQLAVIRRMAIDFGLHTGIVGVPTVRADDGLALSSRNAYLDPGARERALALPRALQSAKAAILAGTPADAALEEAKATLRSAGFDPIDYVALVDSATLEPVDKPAGAARLIAAATLGSTRLIDNLEVNSGPSK